MNKYQIIEILEEYRQVVKKQLSCLQGVLDKINQTPESRKLLEYKIKADSFKLSRINNAIASLEGT